MLKKFYFEKMKFENPGNNIINNIETKKSGLWLTNNQRKNSLGELVNGKFIPVAHFTKFKEILKFGDDK